MSQTSCLWLVGAALALASCGSASDLAGSSAVEKRKDPAAAVAPKPAPISKPAELANAAAAAMPVGVRSCSAEIGDVAAAQRVAVCRNGSPATHPPCNAANSCAMIESEIARSCAVFDGEAVPMAGCESSPKSTEAAVAVVRLYYSAINAHDYGTAWSQWGANGQPGQTRASFEKGFSRTRQTRVTVGPIQPRGAGAGSIYQPVPLTVEATLDDGTRQRYSGIYIVRRVNDVDGASEAQRRWHIGSAELKRIPKP